MARPDITSAATIKVLLELRKTFSDHSKSTCLAAMLMMLHGLIEAGFTDTEELLRDLAWIDNIVKEARAAKSPWSEKVDAKVRETMDGLQKGKPLEVVMKEVEKLLEGD